MIAGQSYKKIKVFLSVILLSVGVFSVVEGFSLLSGWQEGFYDRYFVSREAPSDIVIIAIDDTSLSFLGQWPWKREIFAGIIPALSRAKIVGVDVLFAEESRYGKEDDLSLKLAIENSPSSIVLASRFDDRGGKIIGPIEELRTTSLLGYVNVSVSPDGVVRRVDLDREGSAHFAKILSEETRTPSSLRIDYSGGEKTFTTIPFVDVYQGKIPEALFENKIVIIGATAPDLQDVLQTPFGEMPGVEIQASIISTIRSGIFFSPISFINLIFVALIISVIAALLILFIRKLSVLIPLLLFELISITALSAGAFSLHILIPNLSLTIPFIVTCTLLISYNYVSELKEKQFIRKTFQYYLMPEVIEDLMANPEKLRLGGEKRKVTILFSDIRGFTTLSEKLSPEGLTEILNEYLTEMTDSIMERRGLVDKYIGDAVMAFWGAPVPNENQAIDAADSVLNMMERLQRLNKSLSLRNLPNISIGVGINTGDVVVGNMGSRSRFNYSVLGDDVNFASRLEGLNKPYGTKCIVSESTKKEVEKDGRFILRELDYVKVKGKNEPRRIYELLTEGVTPEKKKVLSLFNNGREAYLKGDFSLAIENLERAIEIEEDGPSRVLLERSIYLRDNPPDSWDGVYEFHTK